MRGTTLWRIRSFMGWGVVILSALFAGGGIFMAWIVIQRGLSSPMLLEPAIFVIFAVLIMRTAHSFLDRRRSGLDP